MLNDWGAVSFESPSTKGHTEGQHFAKMISQVFSDTGEIWGINQHRLREHQQRPIIRSEAVVRDLNQGLKDYLTFATEDLSLKPPFLVIAGLDNVKGLRLTLPNRGKSLPCALESVVMPTARIVDVTTTEPQEVLLPLYRKLWDACDEQYPE